MAVSCPNLPALPHPPNCSTLKHSTVPLQSHFYTTGFTNQEEFPLWEIFCQAGQDGEGSRVEGVGRACSESKCILMCVDVHCRMCQAAGGASSVFLCCLWALSVSVKVTSIPVPFLLFVLLLWFVRPNKTEIQIKSTLKHFFPPIKIEYPIFNEIFHISILQNY